MTYTHTIFDVILWALVFFAAGLCVGTVAMICRVGWLEQWKQEHMIEHEEMDAQMLVLYEWAGKLKRETKEDRSDEPNMPSM